MLLISKVKENLDILELESKEVEIEDLIERFIILDKLDRSNKQSEARQVISHETLKKEVIEWFK
jgi:hypothetical protein